MLNKISKSNKGFTIIEVVLVLAIAAIIMGLVFVAVPAFQAQGRDTARRSDANNVLSAFTRYQSNNNNANPTLSSQLGTYPSTIVLQDQSVPCLGSDAINNRCTNTAGSSIGTIYVTTGTYCNGTSASINNTNNKPKKSSSDKRVSVITPMDNRTDYYCVNN